MITPVQTVNAHYDAIIQKDIEGICAKYFPAADTYVVLEGPRLTTMGYDKIKKGWTDFCASALQLLSIAWTEGPQAEESGDMAWVAGIIKLQVQTGSRTFENTFRASFVLRQYEGRWTIRHEHVSVAHTDPYGIGDWLRTGDLS